MRGGLSYVTMMVLNPIIILFYQNCSVLPAQRAMAQKPQTQQVEQRAPAAVDKKAQAKVTTADCKPGAKNCVRTQ